MNGRSPQGDPVTTDVSYPPTATRQLGAIVMTGEIITEINDSRCTITISNPGKRNALTSSMVTSIGDAIEELNQRDGLYVVVLTGAGTKAFCSGFDIAEFDDDDRMAKEDELTRVLGLVEQTDFPTIARINGDAVGAGFELLAACDLRIAVADARLGLPPAKIGIVLSDRAIRQLLVAVGPTDAKELLFTAELVSAERASEMGLLNDVVDRPALDERTDEMVRRIAANAPLSVLGMKSILRVILEKGTLNRAEQAWARTLREEAFDSRDHEEGRAAFHENRAPEFEGY